MKNVINKLREYGYKLHDDYWVSSYTPGLDLYIEIGRKTKNLDRVRDWYVKPSSSETRFRNSDCLVDAIAAITFQVATINRLE